MNNKQKILGRKVLAVLLLLVVLLTYMPINVVYGVSEAINNEISNEVEVNNTEPVSQEENTEEQLQQPPTEPDVSNIQINNSAESNNDNNVGLNNNAQNTEEQTQKGEQNLENNQQDNNNQNNETTENLNQDLENKNQENQENQVNNENTGANSDKNLSENLADNQENNKETENLEDKVEDNNKLQEENNNTINNNNNLDNEEVDVNTNTVNLITVEGNITWKDNSNAYGTRPSAIKIALIKNDESVPTKELEVVSDSLGNWNYKFEELPEKDENGVNIKYKITTSGVENYSSLIDENNNIQNTLVGNTTIAGNKVWKDNSNAYLTRPESIIVNLYKNNGTNLVESKTVSAGLDGNWNFSFDNLPKYDENGVLIDYSFNENDLLGYQNSVSENNLISKLVGNTEIKGVVGWEDQENQNQLRPDTITINVFKNDELVNAIGISADENGVWNFVINDLPKYDDNGVEINYTVQSNEIENYKTIVEKVNQTEFNITNTFVAKVEMNLTWQEILAYGPYMSMNVEYAKEYGLELSAEEMYIYEKYQEMIYVRGPELAAIAMFDGTEHFSEEELAIYNAYQEIVLNAGEKSPIATMDLIQGTSTQIINNGTQVLKYLQCYGKPVHNSIKYIAPSDRNYAVNGDRVAYCVNYDRSYNNDATYDGTSWKHMNGEYGPVYLKLYSELSYLVSIGCKEFGSHNNSGYSTGGNWAEDYYATQTVIYNVIYDYTDDVTKLAEIIRSIKAQDPNGKLKNINPNDATQVAAIGAHIRNTFSGHPGGNQITLNPDFAESQNVKNVVDKLYAAVKNYRNNYYDQSNADGYAASLKITNTPKLTYVQKSNGKSYYEAIVEVTTTGKLKSGVTITVPNGVTAQKISGTNNFKLTIPKNKIASLGNSFSITVKGSFDASRTITYLSKVSGTQNVAFYQDTSSNPEQKRDTVAITGMKLAAINGNKKWKDNKNEYETRPDSITINLFANGVKVESKTVTSKNGWDYSFVGYPQKDAQGKPIQYTITEESIPNYNSSVSGYNVTNALYGKTNVNITKTWKDNSNAYNTRPEKITIKLLRNGTECKTIELTKSNATDTNTWTYSFTDLDKYDSEGKLYTYTVTENSVQNYKTDINGNAIVNTLVGEIDFAGNKTWYDNNNSYATRPDSILVELFANGAKLQEKTVTSDKDGKWEYIFNGLEKYDSEGKLISYEIKEIQAISSNYESKVDGKNLINTLVGKVKVEVKKAWNDDGNHHQTRPEYITINLLADGVKIDSYNLKEEDNWTHTFEDLDKYTNMGVKISYTITEEALAEFPAGKYVTTVEEGDNSTEDHKQYELTNCLTGQIDVKGSKIWKDNNNEYGTRPDSITINLYRENKYNRKTLVDSKTISADDSGNWYYEFVKLDKYDTKGVEYNYTVEENVLPETEEGHYVDTYKQTSKTHTELVIDITNRLTGTTELGGDKTWKDNNNAYGTRPDSIIVNLLANGQKVQDKEVTEGEKGDWSFFFTNLVKFDEEGKKIEYSISENDIINYVGKVEDTKLTNTLTGKTELSGIKIWHDSDNDYQTRPGSIIVKLLANGKEIDKMTVRPDKRGEWKFTFDDLDEYDENGVKIEYAISEVPVDRYVTDIKGTTLINTLIHNKQEENVIYDITPKTGNKNLLTFFSLTALTSLVGLFIVTKKDEKEF